MRKTGVLQANIVLVQTGLVARPGLVVALRQFIGRTFLDALIVGPIAFLKFALLLRGKISRLNREGANQANQRRGYRRGDNSYRSSFHKRFAVE